MDKNKHLFFMKKLLREFYSDELLSAELRFKGGTSAMLFEGLPRFSTDLDFNLVHRFNQTKVFERIVEILEKNGDIVDKATKRFGPVAVLNYGSGERNLKVEVSNRLFDCHYSMRSFGSGLIPVMDKPDMLTHKLCATLERQAPRDVFDIWFFLSRGWALNENIILERSGKDTKSFLSDCLASVAKVDRVSMMKEIGELLDDSMKSFVRSGKLIGECCAFLDDYISNPLVEKLEPNEHTYLLLENKSLLGVLHKYKVDPSIVSLNQLRDILDGKPVLLHKTSGEGFIIRLSEDKIKIGNGRGI